MIKNLFCSIYNVVFLMQELGEVIIHLANKLMHNSYAFL